VSHASAIEDAPGAGRSALGDRTVFVLLLALSLGMLAGGFWRWPWDHDEVLSFAELGLVPIDQYVGPPEQLRRIKTIVPVWYHAQRFALSWLPHDEFGARVLPVCAAVVLVGVSAWWAWRRGLRFASAVVLLAGSSPMLVWLAQQNRFYSLALCLMAAALFSASSRSASWSRDAWAAVFCLGALLTHNLTLVVFVLAFVAALATRLLGPTPPLLVRRTGLLATVSVVVYLTYLRPALAGWVSGGTGGTLPLVSYVAQLGLGVLGLALLGAVTVFLDADDGEGAWWLGLAGGSVAFVAVVPWLLKAWNPRYALFFTWPVWIVAAYGTRAVAERLTAPALRTAWFGVVLLMLSPKLLSHLADGTRHDFRAAARIVAAEMPGTVLSNWPATLQYYVEQRRPQKVGDWQPGSGLPAGPVVLAVGSNAWEPVLSVADRQVSILAEIRTRRFDEQSHVIRVYRIGARDAQSTPTR